MKSKEQLKKLALYQRKYRKDHPEYVKRCHNIQKPKMKIYLQNSFNKKVSLYLEDYKQSLIKWLEGEKKDKDKFLKSAKDENEVVIQSGLAYGEGFNECIDTVINHLKEQ